MNLIRQQVANPLRKRIHCNTGRPEDKVGGDRLLDYLSSRWIFASVYDAIICYLLDAIRQHSEKYLVATSAN